MDMALTDEKLASMRNDGLNAASPLSTPPGTYQIRAIVREGVKGTLAAITTLVEVQAKVGFAAHRRASFQGPGFLGMEVRYTSVSMYRRSFLKGASLTGLAAIGDAAQTSARDLRIAYGGIGIECSTYSCLRTCMNEFIDFVR